MTQFPSELLPEQSLYLGDRGNSGLEIGGNRHQIEQSTTGVAVTHQCLRHLLCSAIRAVFFEALEWDPIEPFHAFRQTCARTNRIIIDADP